jgi:hypothetical protein
MSPSVNRHKAGMAQSGVIDDMPCGECNIVRCSSCRCLIFAWSRLVIGGTPPRLRHGSSIATEEVRLHNAKLHRLQGMCPSRAPSDDVLVGWKFVSCWHRSALPAAGSWTT